MKFSDQIKKFTDKAERAALYVFRGTSLDIFSKVILRTPVDTGRLRGNWQASLNVSSKDTTESTKLPKPKKTTDKAKITDKLYLINNLPYAPIIEHGASQQAPLGMVKRTVAEFDRIVQANAYKAKKQR